MLRITLVWLLFLNVCVVVNLLADPVQHIAIAFLQGRAADDASQGTQKRFRIALMGPNPTFPNDSARCFNTNSISCTVASVYRGFGTSPRLAR